MTSSNLQHSSQFILVVSHVIPTPQYVYMCVQIILSVCMCVRIRAYIMYTCILLGQFSFLTECDKYRVVKFDVYILSAAVEANNVLSVWLHHIL